MESLDKARARESKRLSNNILKPVEVHSLNDIKGIISEFDPAKNPTAEVIPLNTQLEVKNGNKIDTYSVTAETRSRSKRDHLVDGLTMIKNRIESDQERNNLSEPVEINGRMVYPPKIGNSINSYTWVDPLIKQWLGGSRDGTIIYWDLDGYRYKYNIFEHKLTRVIRQDDPSSSSTV